MKLCYANHLFTKSRQTRHIKTTLRYLIKARNIYQQYPNLNLAKSILSMQIGDAYYKRYQFIDAIKYLNEAIVVIENYKVDLSELSLNIYKKLAISYKCVNNFEGFIKYAIKCMDLNQNESEKIHLLIDISKAYLIIENYDLALCYSQEALELSTKLNNPTFELGKSYLTIGAIYLHQKLYDESIDYLEKTEEIFNQLSGLNKLYIVDLYRLLETVYYHKGYKDTAVYYTSKCKKLFT